MGADASGERPWFLHEKRISLRQARRLFASLPTLSTLNRWRTVGVLTQGEWIKLETFLEGWSRMTTEEAVARFLSATNPPHSRQRQRGPRPKPKK